MEQNIKFTKPWRAVTDGAEELINELTAEAGKGHILNSIKVTPVARRIDNDDVLFRFNKDKTTLAVVHLTWSGKQELNPSFPHTTIYRDMEEWVEICMLPDSYGE